MLLHYYYLRAHVQSLTFVSLLISALMLTESYSLHSTRPRCIISCDVEQLHSSNWHYQGLSWRLLCAYKLNWAPSSRCVSSCTAEEVCHFGVRWKCHWILNSIETRLFPAGWQVQWSTAIWRLAVSRDCGTREKVAKLWLDSSWSIYCPGLYGQVWSPSNNLPQ